MPVIPIIMMSAKSYEILKLTSKRCPSPLKTDAEYGIKNINIMTAANILIYLPSKRSIKNSGMVITSKFWVIILVRLPSTSHAKSEPNSALPTPIQTASSPYTQPNLPAKPIKSTAEKYDVPYANAETHGPIVRPPRKKSPSVDVLRIPQIPIATIKAKKIVNNEIDHIATDLLFIFNQSSRMAITLPMECCTKINLNLYFYQESRLSIIKWF